MFRKLILITTLIYSQIALSQQNDSLSYANLLRTYNELALAGDAKAANKLYFIYREGRGVEKDIRKGIYYLQQAADKGDVAALKNLSVIYRNGLVDKATYESYNTYIVKPDEILSKSLMLEAVSRAEKISSKDFYASFFLAELYNRNSYAFIPRNKKKSLKYWKQAARLAKNLSSDELEIVYIHAASLFEYGSPATAADYGMLLDVLEKGAASGSYRSAMSLSLAYMGQTTNEEFQQYIVDNRLEDSEKAYKVIFDLANMSEPRAQERLSELIFKSCSKTNITCLKKAKSWLIKSMEQNKTAEKLSSLATINLKMEDYKSAMDTMLEYVELPLVPYDWSWGQTVIILAIELNLSSIKENTMLKENKSLAEFYIPFDVMEAFPADTISKWNARFIESLHKMAIDFEMRTKDKKVRSLAISKLAEYYEKGLFGLSPDNDIAQKYRAMLNAVSQ
jgi:TPR repeat protein